MSRPDYGIYDKRKQLAKKKQPNPKKMSKTQYKAYCDFIREKAGFLCQMCETSLLEDMHHAEYGYFGADKDDRFLIGVCRSCHMSCHADRKTNNVAIVIARKNYEDFTHQTGDDPIPVR